MAVGTKMRTQRLRVGSTVTSWDLTPLTGLALGGDVKLMSLRRRRLTVPSRRWEASVTVARTERTMRVFHGREGGF